MSRLEEGEKEIIITTRWSEYDHVGEVLRSDFADQYYRLIMPAYDEAKDEMLAMRS